MMKLATVAFSSGTLLASGFSSQIKFDSADLDAKPQSHSTSKSKETPVVLKKTSRAEDKLDVAQVSALYQGADFPGSSAVMKSIFETTLPDVKAKAEGRKRVQVMGLQNSGLSLLQTMLYMNFGNQLDFHGYDFGPKLDDKHRKDGVWGFANPMELHRTQLQQLIKLSNDDVHLVAVVRDPYSWLSAMRNSSEGSGLESCVQGKDWLTRRCKHQHPAGFLATDPEPNAYPNLLSVWNKWNSAYFGASEWGFKKRFVVTYEDLVGNPDGALKRMAKFLKLEKPVDGWKIPYSAAEMPGRLVSEAAAEKAKAGCIELFSKIEQQQACMRLDKEVLMNFGYTTFDCLQFTAESRASASASIGASAKVGIDAELQLTAPQRYSEDLGRILQQQINDYTASSAEAF